jgi:hypothetical protein
MITIWLIIQALKMLQKQFSWKLYKKKEWIIANSMKHYRPNKISLFKTIIEWINLISKDKIMQHIKHNKINKWPAETA